MRQYRRIFFILLVVTTQSLNEQISGQNYDPLEKQYGTIEYAALVFRHGNRNPHYTYPSDPHKNYNWPGGIGQLTNEGKMRLFRMGQWFKKRYQNLTTQEYDHNHITIQSSDYDRTIMSAQCFLHGFYPATGLQIWLKNETWQPIPVHVIPQEYDNMISILQKCPRLQLIRLASYKTPKYQKIHRDYKDTLEYIEKYSGTNLSNTSGPSVLDHILWLYDTLHIQDQNNLTLPDWTRKVYPEPMRTILEMTVYNKDTDQEEFRLTIGPILKSITSDLAKKTKHVDFTQKLHLYSGHDSTILPIMAALNMHHTITVLGPPYGSTLIFELRKNGTDHFVTILLKNTTEGLPHLLHIPGCELLACTFEEFLAVTKPLIPEDWSRECYEIQHSSSAAMIPNFFLILITLMFSTSK